MAVHLRAIFAPGIRIVGCIPILGLGRGYGGQAMQRLIVLSCVDASPYDAQCQAWSPKREPGSPLDPRSTDCPSLQDPQPTSSINEHSERIYLSINLFINRPISTSNPALAKQLPAVTRSQHLQRPNPQGTAVTASRSHSPIKRI